MSKVALVTGASRGIGKAIALKLAEQGYNIVINYNSNSTAADEVASQIKELGVDAITVQADISNEQDQDKLINSTVEKFGEINVLVNNAGITRDNLLIRMKLEDWQAVLQTNLLSVINLSEKAISQMNKQDGTGKIVNISSIVGVHGNAGQANYASAKAGVISYTKSMARHLMPKIQVNCVAPGLVATDMTSGFDLSKLTDSPLGRPAQPADIANGVSYLVSADYTTGQVLEIDGGLSLWSDVQAFTK